MRNRLGLIAFVLLAFVAGCSSEPSPTSEEANAIEIAKTAIAEHPEWSAYGEFDKPTQDPETGHWTVTAWRDKQARAAALAVDIDGDGKVISISPTY